MKRNIDQDKFVEVCKNAVSMAEACRTLNMAFTTFARYAKKFNCYVTNQGGIGIKKLDPRHWTKQKLISVLNGEDAWNLAFQAYKLKRLLMRFGIKEWKCEMCGLTTWNGSKIPLELHHKDGNRFNNKLENLELTCPNCHAQTPNYRAKNRRVGAADQK